jgi:hypothetical protein
MARRYSSGAHHCYACSKELIGEPFVDDYGELQTTIRAELISCSTCCRQKLADAVKPMLKPKPSDTSGLEPASPAAPPRPLETTEPIEASPITSVRRFFGQTVVDPQAIADDLVRRVDITRGAIKQSQLAIQKQAETLRNGVLLELTVLAGWGSKGQAVTTFDTARGIYDNDFRGIAEQALADEERGKLLFPKNVKFSGSATNPNDQKLTKELATLLRASIDTSQGNAVNYGELALNLRIVIRKVIEKRGQAGYEFLRALLLPQRIRVQEEAIGAALAEVASASIPAATVTTAAVVAKKPLFK